MKVEQNHMLSGSVEEFTLKIVSSGNAFCDSLWQATKLSPPYSRLYYIAEGEGKIKGEEEELTLKAGMLYMIPAGYSFSYSCKNSMHQLYFHLNLMNSGGVDILRGLDKVFCMAAENEHIKQLLELYNSECMTDRLYLKALLERDILILLRNAGIKLESRVYSECVKKALLFIEDNLSAELTISTVAGKIFVSPITLAHKFKNELGISVGRYIDGLVMARAENMLVNTRLTVAQISGSLGFYDQFYFSRRFKERYSVSPLKYRKSHQSTK